MASNKKEYARIRRALARHDTKMMMDCMKAAFQAMGSTKEGEKENKA